MACDDIVFGQASNNKIIEIMLRDSTTGQAKASVAYGSVTYSFIREGTNSTVVTGTCVDMTLDTYADHGWKETSIAGIYQFGIPQAALAAGKNAVTIKLVVYGAIDACKRILIMGSDLRAAALAANVKQWLDTAAHAASEDGTPCVEVVRWGGNDVAATAINGTPKVDLVSILGTALTETAGYIAAAFKKFFNVLNPVHTCLSVDQTIDNPTAAACGTDAASKVLVTPAQKLVTDANGYVTYANAAPPDATAIQSAADAALVANHLDHLLKTAYDPASKPGAADALLNEVIGNDSGVAQFTANALELGPGGGSGGDATAANQTTIIGHLTDLKGAGFSGTTDSNEAISNAVAAITPGTPINVTRTTQIITRGD